MTGLLNAVNQVTLGIFCTDDIDEMCMNVMRLLPEAVPHDKSFFTFSAIGSRKRKTNIHSLTIDREKLRDYIEKFEETDYTNWYLNQKNVHVYRDSQILSGEVMVNTDIYREWIAPLGMHYLCGNVVRNETTRFAELTLMRKKEAGDFTDQELEIFELITEQMQLWFEKKYQAAYALVAQPVVAQTASLQPVVAQTDMAGSRNQMITQTDMAGSRNQMITLTKESELLTMRELDVVNLIIAGLSTREIAEHLSITYATTRRHIANIYEKLHVSSRAKLIRKMNPANYTSVPPAML